MGKKHLKLESKENVCVCAHARVSGSLFLYALSICPKCRGKLSQQNLHGKPSLLAVKALIKLPHALLQFKMTLVLHDLPNKRSQFWC